MATSVQLTKASLRSELKQRLRSISLDERRSQSQIISSLVINSPEYRSSSRISIYLNMAEEVATNDILTDIFKSGRQCFVPRYVGSKMDMLRLRSWEDYESLPMTKWNIKQPSESDTSREEALNSGGLDLIILPGLGFSFNAATGRWARLGRGKGYYDKYLEQFSKLNLKQPLTVGLAFKEQIMDSLPVHDHDEELTQVFHG